MKFAAQSGLTLALLALTLNFAHAENLEAKSTKTRAEVIAELETARKTQPHILDLGVPVFEVNLRTPGKTREQVKAELAEAHAQRKYPVPEFAY